GAAQTKKPATDKLKVFFAHAPEDKSEARKLYKKLKGEGWITPWLTEEDLLPGQDWKLETRKAVSRSGAVLVCLSPEAVGRAGNIQREIRQALDVAEEQPEGAIFIIPLKLKPCEVPIRLKD